MSRIIALLLAAAICATAQHAHAPARTAEKPVTLLTGLGTHTKAITTKNADAQRYFDQGLRLMYAFNRYEALRSFRKAAELDPQAVMPLWGIAMATGPGVNMDMDGDVDLKQGCAALDRARTLKASAYENAYVTAAATRCPEYEPASYIRAARALHEAYPDDTDAAALYAESIMIPVRWKWFAPDGTPAGEMATAITVLERAMRRDANHPGANHFYIHAVEMSPSPERAIPSCQRLMGILPAAGHLVHMPGHIWLLLGEWDLAAAVNERAAQVDRNYFASTKVESGYLGYYLHNLHFIAYARGMQGRGVASVKAAEFMAKEAAPMAAQMPEMADAIVAYPILMRVRAAQWGGLLAMAQPDEKLLTTRALWHWARALAYHAQGRATEARAEADQFRAAHVSLPATRPWLNNKAAQVLEVASLELSARLATGAAATEFWERAVALQDQLNYEEPPPWYRPLRESWAGSLLRNGQAEAAERIFREALRQSPHNGRLLFGLWKSLEAQNKQEPAAMVRREFERDWKGADVTLRVEDL